MESLRLFIRLTRPIFLLGAAMLYALGVGIAHYLGARVDLLVYLLGQAWVSLLQLSAQYLNEYFNAPADQNNPQRTFLTGGSGAIGPGKLDRQVALMAAYTCLAVLASLTVLIIARIKLGAPVYLIMALAFLGALFYSTPPIKLEGTGYGELVTSVLLAFMVPAFAFLLQEGELHRLVAMSAFPLTAMHLAMLLAFELPDYATDLKYGKRTLLVRIGWQNGMLMHNLLILSAFLLLGAASLFGYPSFAMWSGLLALPIGLVQIWQMRRVADGAKPNWNALTVIALTSFSLMVYLITFSFWIN
ncbi:MAG: prenyltransferase [Anaerolineales bacterium]|nr:prenyltransferase [Anaerolineales bacterium]